MIIAGVFLMPVLMLVLGAVYFPVGIILLLCDDYDKTLGPYRPWERR